MPDEEDWETEEVIKWLINDEDMYRIYRGKPAQEIERRVREGFAPQGLYDQFNLPPKSSFDYVNWNEVAKALQ